MSESKNDKRLRASCNRFVNAWMSIVLGCYLGFSFAIYYFEIELSLVHPIRLAWLTGMPLFVMVFPKAIFEIVFGISDYLSKRKAFSQKQMTH